MYLYICKRYTHTYANLQLPIHQASQGFAQLQDMKMRFWIFFSHFIMQMLCRPNRKLSCTLRNRIECAIYCNHRQRMNVT